jgi:hypothetical protein
MDKKINKNIILWGALLAGIYFVAKPIIGALTNADKKAALDEFNNGDEWDIDFGIDNDKMALNKSLRDGIPYSGYAYKLITYLSTNPSSADYNNVFNIISKMRSKSELSYLGRTYTALNTKGYTLAQDLIGQDLGHGLTWGQNKKITDLTSRLPIYL